MIDLKRILRSRRNRKIAIGVIAAILLLSVSLVFLSSNKDHEVAINVSDQAIDQELAIRQHFYDVNNQQIDQETLRNDVVASLEEQARIEQAATDKGITVSEEEINDYYSQRVTQYESEQELLGEISRLYGISKDQFLEQLRSTILSEKVANIFD